MTTPSPDYRGLIEQALADYDAKIAPCPINGPRPPKHREECPECGANSSQACGLERAASHRFIMQARQALSGGKGTEI